MANENRHSRGLTNRRKVITLTGETMRVLVVEDDRPVASFIKKGLESEQYAVDLAWDGEDAP
jgi:PleD family two-component response regulator